ncbi:hypothetical protein Pelo_19635 [Pelomyxa schiedti]|nr:hypothetical protein Pelo_19635 [Pelomyxa schiedti]
MRNLKFQDPSASASGVNTHYHGIDDKCRNSIRGHDDGSEASCHRPIRGRQDDDDKETVEEGSGCTIQANNSSERLPFGILQAKSAMQNCQGSTTRVPSPFL